MPGNSIKLANDEVIRIKTQGLVDLGILKGDVDKLIEEKAYRQFYMHGLGHWLGLDVHVLVATTMIVAARLKWG